MANDLEAENLLDLYIAHCGYSEVPRLYHKWCLYSLIAACAGDRIGYRYKPEAVTVPAIYVFLVGPSGWGKNESIDEALKFANTLDAVHTYGGRSSGPALIREIGIGQEGGVAGQPIPKFWYVTPELGMSIGEGPKAMDTIKIVTELFSMAGKKKTLRDSSLSFGRTTVENPCLNWLAGTTVKWLKRSVSHDDIEAGFGSRVFMIYVDIDANAPRIPRPIMPDNYWDLRNAIQTRLERITRMVGEFRMTQGALQVEEQWYMTRPGPDNAMFAAWWKRERELCLKMAMILSLCDREDLIITDHHIAQAQEEVAQAGRHLQMLVSTAGISDDYSGLDAVQDYIKRTGVVPHKQLMRFGIRQGLSAEKLASILRTLAEGGRVQALDKQGKVLPGWRGNFYAYAEAADHMPDVGFGEADGEPPPEQEWTH